MRLAIFLTVLAAATGARAETRTEVCRKGADERLVEIAAPGTVGSACDVVYVRDGGANVTIPYNANIDVAFCRARAAELVATLMADGFECAQKSTAELEAALAGGSEPAPAEAPAPQPVAVAAMPPEGGAAIVPPEEGAAPDASSPPAAETSIAPAVVAEALDRPLNEQLETLAQPAVVAQSEPALTAPEVVGAPVQLASEAQPIGYRAPRPSRTAGAGRLLGATPSLEGIVEEAAPAAPTPKPTEAKLVTGISARPAEDVIKGVVAAAAAAWNEGNLSAYLAGYADTPDVTMIKDATSVSGFGAIKKRFEQDIAATGAMGRLDFSALNVSMTADDVATVVGRYSIGSPASKSEGSMTLVMKQAEGRWRIVNDMRVADAPPAPVARN